MRILGIVSIILNVCVALSASAGSGFEEFNVKRQNVFEFVDAPTVTQDGDNATVRFSVKAYCDVTIAVENRAGKIVRHLASGVLGPKAPAPFQKGSLKQSIHWDGKDDQGRYVDAKQNCSVRVSLGFKPRFERSLFWEPKKRVTSWGNGKKTRLVKAAPEGVYVYDSQVFDHVRLFDHQGEYLRTIYPFPAAKVNQVEGLRTHTFPHDGQKLPLKTGFYQSSLLWGKKLPLNVKRGNTGFQAYSLAVQGKRMALAGKWLCRLATDGTSGGVNLAGPDVRLNVNIKAGPNMAWKERPVTPWYSAFSPDGKWLYLSGYAWRYYGNWHGLHGVTRVAFDKDAPPKLFVGDMKPDGAGKENGKFRIAGGVACDAQGRVYVADHMNNRVQVFSPEGKHLKNISVFRPAQVSVHQKTGEVFVFSWVIHNSYLSKENDLIAPTLFHLGSFDDSKLIGKYSLPLKACDPKRPIPRWLGEYTGNPGVVFWGEVDTWADAPTVWLSRPNLGKRVHQSWASTGLLMMQVKKGKLVTVKDFGKQVHASVKRNTPPMLDRQRLYFNPGDEMLYIGEADAGVGKSFKQVVRVDPKSGQVSLQDLPFDCEDMCFDAEGLAYLRTGKEVVRYDSKTWREVPWDYGEERAGIGFCSSEGRQAPAIAALKTPGHRSFAFWHLGGMDVSLNGNLVVTTCNGSQLQNRPGSSRADKKDFKYSGQNYVPKMYPGRPRWGEIHVFDRHGQPKIIDALPGIGHANGIALDRDDNIYISLNAKRIINGKPYDPLLTDDLSETLIKAHPNRAKVLSTGKTVGIPLAPEARPKRSLDVKGTSIGGSAWVEDADWLYGGLGFSGKNAAWDGGGCACWNARFDMDYFDRSFAPELRHFSVAVLDANGNLITRIGRYGNVDDGKPLVPDPRQKHTRSIGGDEVALFHGAYLAAHSDRRIFIADPGNGRIASVKLGYHTEKSLPLSQP